MTTGTILDEIIEWKREEVACRKQVLPLVEVQADIARAPGAGMFDQGQRGNRSHDLPAIQEASFRVDPRRMTAPPSPSMISVSPRSA